MPRPVLQVLPEYLILPYIPRDGLRVVECLRTHDLVPCSQLGHSARRRSRARAERLAALFSDTMLWLTPIMLPIIPTGIKSKTKSIVRVL